MRGEMVLAAMARAGKVALASSLLLAAWPAPAGVGQIPSQAPGYTRPQAPGLSGHEPEPVPGPNATKLEHMREDERRKRLLADTAKLLQLSTELKEQVDKSAKDELSLDVVRKAAEIERLARDVKERMKG